MKRYRKVGLTTNLNQTGTTLTSVAVVISTTGVRVCPLNLRSSEKVNCIQTVSASDLIQQGGRAGRVAPEEHYVMASEDPFMNQFRGASTPELLNTDVAPLISVCKMIGEDPATFPTLNVPDEKVINATRQRKRMLGMVDDAGRLTPMGRSKISFDFNPKWGRFLAKAAEYGVLKGAIKIAAVLSREDSFCTMQVFEVYNHPDRILMSLLQALDFIEPILNSYRVEVIHRLPKVESTLKALRSAGFEIRSVIQIWLNMEQICDAITEVDLPRANRRPRSDKYHTTLLVHALWEGFRMQKKMRSDTGKYVSPTHGGQWSLGHTMLLLPIKKSIVDGNAVLTWITPVPVEWLVERDWWVRTH